MTLRSTDPGQPRAAAPRVWRAPVPAKVASLVPFFLAAFLQLPSPRFSSPMFSGPEIVGLPVAAVVGALILAWAGLGALIVWTTGSRAASALALAFLTLPSMFGLVFAPAMLLILQSFGALD
jgi:hypothetical protein